MANIHRIKILIEAVYHDYLFCSMHAIGTYTMTNWGT